MLSAYSLLYEKDQQKIDKRKLSFDKIADLLIDRQKVKKDSIILISGLRGNGKSTWALNVIKPLIKKLKQRDPEFRFGVNNESHWNLHFSDDRASAIKKLEKKLIPEYTFHVIDEGGDIALSGNAMEREQKLLQQIIMKTRNQYHITIINIPNIFKLDKTIREEACLSILVEYRFLNVCSFAFIFGRASSSVSMDRFGFDNMRKYVESRKGTPLRLASLDGRMKVKYKGDRSEIDENLIFDDDHIIVPFDKKLFDFYLKQPNCKGVMRFRQADKELYDSYERFIKSKAMNRTDKITFVSKAKFDKLNYMYKVLIRNLIVKHGLNYAQIERLHIDNAGIRLTTATNVRKRYEEVEINE